MRSIYWMPRSIDCLHFGGLGAVSGSVSTKSMSDSYQQQLRERLERFPYSDSPQPWRVVGVSGIGGLTEVGFADGTDDLLIVSSQGRGLFDCLSGERLSRDPAESFENPDETGLSAPGIGRHEKTTFRLAGLMGGGLATSTRDGWAIHVVHLPWPEHVVFLTSEFNELCDDARHITKLCNDGPCTFRAAGFSPTGRSFVVATSCEVAIYARNTE